MYYPNSYNITKEDEKKIIQDHAKGVSIGQLSRTYKISTSRVRKIIRGVIDEKNK